MTQTLNKNFIYLNSYFNQKVVYLKASRKKKVYKPFLNALIV